MEKKKQKQTLITQSDIYHKCNARMWFCSECKDDFCMSEEPKFCPMCGQRPEEVKTRGDKPFVDG
jgi:rubrerythrin